MKKSDLKDGMIVELRNGKRAIVLNDYLLGLEMWFYLSHQYNDNLTYVNGEEKRLTEPFDIIKVYKTDFSSLERLLLDKKLELIWERKEIDWNKVPFGTMVKCWSHESSNKYIGRFLGYDECASHKFMVFVSTDMVIDWDYCELKDLKWEITGENLNDEFNRYCDKYECDDCYYDSTPDCRLYWMVDNFNLTKK